MRNRLIDLTLAGKSAKHIVDALVEELPPLPMLYQIVHKELPKGTGVRIEEYDDSISVGDGTPVFVTPASKSTVAKVRERADYLQLMFPELEFIVEQALTDDKKPVKLLASESVTEDVMSIEIPKGVSKSDADMARAYFKGFHKYIAAVDLVGTKYKISIDRGAPSDLKDKLRKAISDPSNY